MSGNLLRSERKENERKAAEKSTTNQDNSSNDCSRSTLNERRLRDINAQLKIAQSKCNYLKDQLDCVKKLYGVNRNRLPYMQRKISDEHKPTATFETAGVPKENSQYQGATNATQSPKVPVNCQTSNHIGTDSSETSIRTISIILNRITNPANRLLEIHSQLSTHRMKISSEANANAPVRTNNIGVVPKLKIESLISIAPKHRNLKKIASRSGKHSIIAKKPVRIEKKMRAKSKIGLEKKCSAVITNELVSKLNSENNNGVEIYQNEKVEHNYSDERDLKKSQEQSERYSRKNVPPLNMHVINQHNSPEQTAATTLMYPAGLTGQFINKSPEALRTEVKWVYSKSYKLPTVASRMKQVPKAYMRNVNLNTIPFCAAISTTQSHNIGINIQQVMNIIKNRQPVNGISPTLAYNIGLAAEKLNNKSFSAFVSSINSQISQSVSRCPLEKSVLNIRQLQKQVQTIPKGTIEEAGEAVGEDAREAPEAQTMLIIGPSGDMDTKTKTIPNWKVDKNVNTEQCICLAQKIKTLTENGLNSQEKKLKKRLKGYKTTTGSRLDAKVQPKVAAFQELQVHATTQQENMNVKEENPKGFLLNLHTDFEYVNSRFEDSSQRSQAAESGTLIKELGRLEEELNKKEEAITLEMTLYKELLALKQEVKQLKEERSRSSVPSREHNQDPEIRYKECRNPEAAFLFTKLLKLIQHCQMIYKSSLSQE